MREVSKAEEKRIEEDVRQWVERVLLDYARAMEVGEGAVLIIGRRRFVVRDGQLRKAE